MSFCPKCGTQTPDGVRFCPTCGNTLGSGPVVRSQLPPDVEENRWMAVFCYLGILLIFPAILKRDSEYVRFHINQGLVLLLFYFACAIVCIIPILGWLAGGIGAIFAIVCAIMGIVYAASGRTKELPIIGQIRIYK